MTEKKKYFINYLNSNYVLTFKSKKTSVVKVTHVGERAEVRIMIRTIVIMVVIATTSSLHTSVRG